ncbi:MAG TPA: NAD(P)-dependent oxidoreductase [Bryobacteraceae bacterium]|nr:NAD(P)-dependent oxidoreductase [Bryobacteraceae bacterium]
MKRLLPEIEALEEELSRPTEADYALMRGLEGDLMVLGAGGKMGPSLARRARRAADRADPGRRVIAVSRFASEESRRQLADWGVETIACDLLDREHVARLPDCPNVLFLAGRKFGSTDDLPLTWATNVLLPALAVERFRGARIVALSSGNVYPLATEAATEKTTPAPVGEYAQSVLGRERVFEYFSARNGTPVVLIRLNYAIDLRYGVLLDIGERVWRRQAVRLDMGAVNVIWQGDANSACLRALALASSPPLVVNVTGRETLAVRWIAGRFGEIFGIEPAFEGGEAATALLSDASLAERLLGPPCVSPETMVERTAEWIRAGAPTYHKPTHFEVRDGAF